MTELATASGLETAAMIARGDVTQREVVDAAIARAEVADLGAIVVDTFAAAREAAPGTGVFGGVPTFIKDLSHVRGVATSWGSDPANAVVAKRDDAFVKRLRETGVIVLGKSAAPELGLAATTEPAGRAPCRNPWDRGRSAGGSSGGAGALVAAGVVPIAHGTDGGGSIRIPAAACGVVGMKPSRGMIDMDGSRLLPINIACNGLLTRDIADQVAFYDALGLAKRPAAEGPLRIAVFVDSPTGRPVHPDTQRAVRDAGAACAALGHHVDELASPYAAVVLDDFLQYWSFIAWIQLKTARAMLHRGFDRARAEAWSNSLAGTFRTGATFSAVRRLRAFARSYARMFEAHDVIVSPTTAEPAPVLGYLADPTFETAYERIRAYCSFTPIQNIAGAPAISLPLGRTSTNLPIGVQFAAARGHDRTLLALAASLQQARPWPLTC